jgi:glycosyltransferase involved in cell wall biosynthesis
MDRTPLVVFSHLRWDFVYQRPQHVMSRLAAYRPVLFVEEPIVQPGKMALEVEAVAPGVRVARPVVPVEGPAFGSSQETPLISLLRSRLAADQWRRVVAWLYTPMAVRIAKGLHPEAIVYDCMDDLSGFLGAPQDIHTKDRELLAAANAVMTGGPSLWKLKSERHAYVHCFPSSVDIEHFRPSAHKTSANAEPEDQADLPRPRLGYSGVIDERMDLEILAAMSDAHPEWQIVLVGPVVKIDPATLPRSPNLHFLGRKDYSELPAHLAGWDVALIPFARNSATKYISPTKILEYMAADRLIVSTAIADVAEPYGDIVFLGDTPEEFVRACESALGCSEIEVATRRARARRVLSRTSWDDTARRMDEIIQTVTAEAPSPGLAVAGAGGS